MVQKTVSKRVFSVILAAFIVFAGDTVPAFAQPTAGGSVAIGFSSIPRHFNGVVQAGMATALPGTQIFASPLRFDENWNPQPYLAEKWEVAADGLSVTLHLVKNAVFHDGVPVTSKDVAFSIESIQQYHPSGKTMLGPVSRVETPDDHTVILRLSEPHPAILLAMCPALMPVLPKHVYGTGEDLKSHPANLKPVGSGPYKLTEHVQGEYYTLEKFDKFFIPGRPYLDKIVVRLIPDTNNLLLSLEKGEVDIVPYFSDLHGLQRLEKAKGVSVTNKGYEGVGALNWLAFNTKKPPLDDVRVRQAIAYAVDRDFIIKKLMFDKATPAYAPIAPSSPFATSDVEHYSVDIAKANALLDAAGHKKGADGKRFTLQVDYTPGFEFQQRNIAEYLRPQLDKIGIDIKVRTAPDFPTWVQRISNYDFDLTMDIVFNWGDPAIGVARTYLSSNIRKGVPWSNTQQYVNPQVDTLLAQASATFDTERRKALYAEFQKIVVADVPIFFINAIPYYTAYRDGLKGLPLSIWGVLSPLDDLYLENRK